MPAFFPENNTPMPLDSERRSLLKILDQLQQGIPVTGVTLNGDVSVGAMTISQTSPGVTNGVVVNSSALPTGAATQTTLAAVLAKIIAAPATEAKQDTGNTTLASILAKIIAAPATEAKQDALNALATTINGKITACNTGAVVVSSSALPAGASTEATLAALSAKLTVCNTDAVIVDSGNITSTPVAPSIAASTAYEASRVVKATAGRLFSLTGYNSGPAQFIQIFNATAVPANGAAPLLVVGVPATSTFAFEWQNGIPCSTGISVSNSSTAPIRTVGSADCFLTATFI